ncbi:hypothetical protein L798_08171 [Zootermopsis nevadensis]|uniref:Zinc finger PHD-type domain-containing protein n=1 Tax=Zootermopsis nevadensis TaxID=136037 RepID=A0A067RDE6_ZOONE|nr:hypothetical protein L798_08171 [Zootermopsis nevadensis]
MVASKDCCSVCKRPFHGKQKCIRCSGPCGSRLHLSCLNMSDTEYSLFMVDGQSTYNCVSCVLLSRASSPKNTRRRSLRSASTSELPVKDISPDGASMPLDPESLGVQIEMVRRNGASTHKLVENLVQMVLKLSEDVQLLRKDNGYLKSQLAKLASCAPAPAVPPSIQKPSSLVYDDAAHKAADPALCSASTSADAGSKSYKDILSAGLKPKVSGAESEDFITVSYKKKPTSVMPSVNTVNTVRQRRQPLIGVRNSAALPIVCKRERSKALFVSRFSPGVSAADVEKSLKEQLSLKRLVCTRLKTKFDAYASFHISVNEVDFPLINNTGVWPNGCLIAPFYGKLTPDQVYSSSTPQSSAVLSPAGNIPIAPEEGSIPL